MKKNTNAYRLPKYKKSNITICCLFLICLALVSCGQKDNTRDIQQFIANLKKQSTNHHHSTPTVNFHKEVSYSGDNLRNPFPQQLINTITAANAPLERYPLDALHLVGIVQQDEQLFAVILAPDKKIYTAKVNDSIGNEHGKISQIINQEMTVTEPANSTAGLLTEKTVTLRLKD